MAKSLYELLTKRIDLHYSEIKTSNLFYQRIFSGKISIDELALFIHNVSHLTAFTPLHLNMAFEVAQKKSLKELAHYFKSKQKEELGHSEWGENDAKGIASRFPNSTRYLEVLPEMHEYLVSIERMIQKDPYQYFLYILFAEYFTVIAGPESLAAIERSCSLPPEMMSIIALHAELDKQHVKEWEHEAIKVGMSSAHATFYLATLDQIIQRYDIFCKALSCHHAKAA